MRTSGIPACKPMKKEIFRKYSLGKMDEFQAMAGGNGMCFINIK